MNEKKKLINLIFPDNLPTPEELEKKYPKRTLSDNSIVTRFAPSPTGFIHIGGIYIAVIGKNLSRHTNGSYFIRIEDTDQKRKVDDSKTQFEKTFKYFNIESDENDSNSKWGPFTQSNRSELYLSYVKYLMEKGRAYPCFCTKEELEEISSKQRDAKIDIGYYGKWAIYRNMDVKEAIKKIESGIPYVIRFKSFGEGEPIIFNDLIRGKVKARNNINDIVILKSSSNKIQLPTYHLAHAVDDHLMRVNVVLRAEEWLSSVPLHFQLFDALGFDRIPYAHIAPLMKLDGKSKRKLSKRKDPEASVGYYMENGYPVDSVIIYLMGLANSNLADTPLDDILSSPIKLNKMPKAGALIDMQKLNDISSDYIGTMQPGEIRKSIFEWAKTYDKELSNVIENKWDYSLEVIKTDRINNGKVRKDLSKWSDFRPKYEFFFKEFFRPLSTTEREIIEKYSNDSVNKILQGLVNQFQGNLDNTDWFEFIKDISSKSGFAINNKEFKNNPNNYQGTLRDSTKIIRVVLTGKERGPSLHEICITLGKTEIERRILLYKKIN